MNEVASLVSAYEEGLLTFGELIQKLMDLAITIEPAQFMPHLPANLSSAIQSNPNVVSPPATIDDLFALHSGMHKPGINVQHAITRGKAESFKALWALHNYFGSLGAGR